jgi:glycoside hydrolase family 92 protein
MNRLFLSLISLAACMTSCTSPEPLTDYVDPRIGTAHSRWFFFTPAAVPFGMAKLAPTTDGHLGNPGGWQAVGYDARHTSIEGFANFHEFQVGGVVIAPTVGALQTVPGPLDDPEAGYRSRFDKKDEVARPGYYSVLLKDYGVKAELTATERVGFHRYTFPASEEANLDLQHRHEDGRERSCARRFGDLHRGRPYRGLGGDRTRLCGHLSEGRRREDVFQRRRGCRTCVVGRLLRRGGFCR